MSPDDFLIEDYKLAVEYLQAQFQRLWQRFNYFLTIHTALFGFVGWLAFDKRALLAIPLVATLGALLSALWYVVAAQDRFLVQIYRDRVESAAKKIASVGALEAGDYGLTYIGAQAQSAWKSLGSWYWRPLSVTQLPAWIAIFLTAVWLALLLNGVSWLQPLLPQQK